VRVERPEVTTSSVFIMTNTSTESDSTDSGSGESPFLIGGEVGYSILCNAVMIIIYFTHLELPSQSNLFHCLQVLFYENRKRNEWITPVTTSDSTTSEPTSTAELGSGETELHLTNDNVRYTYTQSSANRNSSKTEEVDSTVLHPTSFKNMKSFLGYDDTELPLPEQIVELLGKLNNIYVILYIITN